MPHLLIRQRFEDFTRWSENFHGLDDVRAAAGMRTVLVSRNAEDPQEAVVLFAFEDAAKVKAHFGSPALKDAHVKAGVVPDSTSATFLVDVE